MSTKHAFELANQKAYEKLASLGAAIRHFNGDPIQDVRCRAKGLFKRDVLRELF